MKLSPQSIGVVLKQHSELLDMLQKRVEELEVLHASVDELKEIIHKLLMTHNPKYRSRAAMDGVDDFLRKRSGRSRPSVTDQG